MKTQDIQGEIPLRKGKAAGRGKKVRRTLIWLKLLLLLVLFTVTVVLLAISPIFNIAGITVEGSTRYPPEDIEAKSGILLGTNAFKVMASDAESLMKLRFGPAEQGILKSSPYVKAVAARLVLPNKVRIVITEREPVAVLTQAGKNLLLDVDGIILEAVDKGDKRELPVITGLNVGKYEPGQALPHANPGIVKQVTELLLFMEEQDEEGDVKLRPLVTAIRIGNPDEIEIVLESRVTVNLGDLDNLQYRLAFLKQIFKKGIKKDERGYLDFTNGENPNFIPQRGQEEPQ